MTAPVAQPLMPAISESATDVPALAPEEKPDAPRSINARSLDDVASLFGSVAASLAVAWILYDNILPTAGKVGFFVVWYVLFLVIYAAVVSISNSRPAVLDKMSAAIFTGGAAIVGAALAWMVLYVFWRGWPALQPLELLHEGHERDQPDGAVVAGRDLSRDRRVGDRGRDRGLHLGAGRHRNRDLHDRGRRSVLANRADCDRGHDRAAPTWSRVCLSTRSSSCCWRNGRSPPARSRREMASQRHSRCRSRCCPSSRDPARSCCASYPVVCVKLASRLVRRNGQRLRTWSCPPHFPGSPPLSSSGWRAESARPRH